MFATGTPPAPKLRLRRADVGIVPRPCAAEAKFTARFECVCALRPTERVGVGVQRTLRIAVAAVETSPIHEVFGKECCQHFERNPVFHGKQRKRLLCLRRELGGVVIVFSSHVERRPDIQRRLFVTDAQFIQKRRGQRGNQGIRKQPRGAACRAAVAARPLRDAGLRVHSKSAFPRVDHAELVIGVEVVIDPHVELIAVFVLGNSHSMIEAADAADEANAGGIQAVADRVVVRQRHSREQHVLDEAGRIVSRPE